MALTPDELTIAVTVYNRREYLGQAIRSALDQTVPVRVIVVEDCGPDAAMQRFVKQEFGDRVEYFRNPRRRGLFDNWNACLEYCRTPWLSILHDDDYLTTNFVAAMQRLAEKAPGRGFYFGQVAVVEARGVACPPPAFPAGALWCEVDIVSFAKRNPVLFPGQLFRADYARAWGGFRATSLFAGDWEMWFKLCARHGGAQTAEMVAGVRSHSGGERGTTKIVRLGKQYALNNVQAKRNLALLRAMGMDTPFRRKETHAELPIPTKLLLPYAAGFSRRVLRYNTHMLLESHAPHWRYAGFQLAARLFGARFVKAASWAWNLFHRTSGRASGH
jgi:hypothetical protein